MKIGKFDLNEDVMVVAEIGNNHEGNFDTAKRLTEMAAKCGVDAVKFQTFKTELFVSHSDTARFDRLKSFELSYSQFERLSELAHSLGLLFISTPFDLKSGEFLRSIVDCYKIASGDNNFFPLINQVVQTEKPVMLSTGLCDWQQVEQTISFIRGKMAGSEISNKLAVLHCVSCYPVKPEEANLRSIPYLKGRLNVNVGYSDHTEGIDAVILAVALGADIVEKHFTLDKNYSSFRDHQLSADPVEMSDLVKRIRQTSLMLGKYGKIVQPCEGQVATNSRRSIVAERDLPAGHCIGFSDLMWTRPAGGLTPGEEGRLVGKKLRRPLSFGEPIHLSDVN
jgi:sialic acid synthase SpsE